MATKEVRCICKSCPSFVECKEEIGYCVHKSGKSRCIKQESGCLCPSCPVQAKMGFTKVYYCTRGSNKEQQK